MSVALVPCNTRCLNMGDVAMLQVAVTRLRAMWPDEELRIFTSDAEALARYCPDVTPVMLPDQPGWCTDRYLGGRLHTWLPERLSDRLADAVVETACRAPSLREHLLRLRSTVRPPDRRSLRAFIDTIAQRASARRRRRGRRGRSLRRLLESRAARAAVRAPPRHSDGDHGPRLRPA